MTRLKEKKNEKANLTDSHFKSKTSKKFRNGQKVWVCIDLV